MLTSQYTCITPLGLTFTPIPNEALPLQAVPAGKVGVVALGRISTGSVAKSLLLGIEPLIVPHTMQIFPILTAHMELIVYVAAVVTPSE